MFKKFCLIYLAASLISCEEKKGNYPIIDPLKDSALLSRQNTNKINFRASVSQNIYFKAIPSKSLFENLSLSKSHTLFVAAIKFSGADKLLGGEDNYTVFAPLDQAFKKMPKQSQDDLIKPTDKNLILQFVMDHIVKGKVSLKDIRNAQTLTSLGGKKIPVINLNELFTINGNNVLSIDDECKNGYINILNDIIR